MEGKKRWADYTDSDSELETSESVHEDLSEPSHLPYYLKILNFPYSAREEEVIDFLELDSRNSLQLKLLYSRGSKKKFRGIAIFTVSDLKLGAKILGLDGRLFSGRRIKIEALPVWKEH